MSEAVHLELAPDDVARLERLACRWGQSPAAEAALLLHEKLAEAEFPLIEFRETAVGRQAYVKGTRVQVWMVLLLAHSYEMSVRGVAEHLDWPDDKVQAALAYAAANPDEIQPLVEYAENFTFDDLKRELPWAQEVKF